MKQIVAVLVAGVFFLGAGTTFAKGGKWFGKDKQEAKQAIDQQTPSAQKVSNQIQDQADKKGKEVKGKAEKVKKDAAKKVSDANEAGRKKFLGFSYGKSHAEQLKALDEKAAKNAARSQEKIAGLEKEVADARTANDTKKVTKLENKIEKARETAAQENKKIELQREEIKTKMQQ